MVRTWAIQQADCTSPVLLLI